jgi:fucose permease
MSHQSSKNFAIPLAFVGLMFFTLGFALGINSFLIPVLKGSLNLSSGVAYLLLAASFNGRFVILRVSAMPHSRALASRRSLTSVMSTRFAPP